ncbi:MAG TPA: Hsp20/alpha crystallin family protein [Candidatus Acidoferrales bacterium]|nr:Hsp20/alpha crystallin family protein [Candidatus Acidoferrales bacterium]
MTNLIPRDAFFQDLFDFRRDFDQIFNRILMGKPWEKELFAPGTSFNFVPAVETFVDKDSKKYFCRVTLPGIEPKDVQIHVQGNLLTISGERKLTRTNKELDLFDEEIVYGKFERELTLPEGVNTDKLFAEYANGVLEVTAPVLAAALPRKVEIKTVPMIKQVAA